MAESVEEAKMITNDKMFAPDTNLIIFLARLHNYITNGTEEDDKVFQAINQNRLLPVNYAGIPHSELPPVLQDEYFGYYETIKTKDKSFTIYGRLLDYYATYKLIISGSIKFNIVPIIKEQLHYFSRQPKFAYIAPFVGKYCKFINIADRDMKSFIEKRDELVDEYINSGTMKEEIDEVRETQSRNNTNGVLTYGDELPSDACGVAEATLCGLSFVTADAKDCIHRYPIDENGNEIKYNPDGTKIENYERANMIGKINAKNGYIFTDAYGRAFIPGPVLPDKLRVSLKRHQKGIDYYPFYAKNPNLDLMNFWEK